MEAGATRRDAVRIGLGLAATAATGLSGCLGGILDGGVPGPAFAAWLPTPAALGVGRHYEFTQFGVATYREHRERFADPVAASLTESVARVTDSAGVDPGTVDWYVHPASGTVGDGPAAAIAGSFDRDGLAAALTDRGFESGSATGEFRVLANPDAERAVAVSGDRVVTATAGLGEDPVALVEVVVDAGTGDAERYVESSADAAYLLERLAPGLLVAGRTTDRLRETRPGSSEPHFRGQVASGISLDVDGDTASMEYRVVYESADAVNRGQVRTWIRNRESAGGLFRRFGNVELGREDRSAFVRGTRPTGELFTD